METEATLDLLYKELDHSMLENENHQTDTSLTSNSNENETKNVLEQVDEDDEVDTQVNADSPLLSSPFKMQQDNQSNSNIQLGFEKPILRNVNVESFSGGTYINHSTKQEKQMSPGSVKLMNLLDQDSNEGNNENDSLNIDKLRQNTTSMVNSLSLESSKPLLSHQSNENNDSKTPYRLSMISTYGDEELEDSPQIVRSPAKIPLTNIMNINQFANGSLSDSSDEQSENGEDANENSEFTTSESNLDIPTTRFSSGSSYTNDKLDLFTTQIKDEFNLLNHNASESNHKEYGELKEDKEDVAKITASGFDKLYKGRMASIATSIGDYQSARENQTKSQLVSEASESIADLSISTGVDLADVTFQETVQDEESLLHIGQNETDSSEMIHSKTLESISQQNITIQKENIEDLSQSSLRSEDASNYEVQTENTTEIQEVSKNDNDLPNSTTSDEEYPLNETESIIPKDENTNDLSDMIESNTTKKLDATSKEDSFSSKMIPNHLLVESLRMETSRESTQTLELDVSSIAEKKNKDAQLLPDEVIAESMDSEPELTADREENQSTTVTLFEKEAELVETNESIEKEVDSKEDAPVQATEEEEEEEEEEKTPSETNKDAAIRIPSIQKESTLELKFIDDIFNSESDTSVASIEEELLKRPDNYLAIWHIQEKKEPALNLKVKGFVSDTPKKQQLQKKPSKKLEKVNYSFKPTIIHNPKINYLERNVSIKDDTPDITTSLSQEFENALKKFTTEPPSRSTSILRRPVNIWTKSEDTSDIEKFQDTKKIVLQEAFGEDLSAGTFKTPGKTPIVNKADSIKSFQVDDDDDFDISSISPATPIKEKSVEFKPSPRGEGHVSSPFKIISKNNKGRTSESPSKLISEHKPVIITPTTKEESVAEHTEQDILTPEENITGGVLFMNLDSITVSLTGAKQHEAQFSLEIDNGVNVTKTGWKSLNNDNMLVLGNELAIPIDGEAQEKLFFTLKCKFRRPQKQLVEVVEKVRVGKSFGGLGKSKYVYEKRYAQRNITHDEWDYLFAQDGSFARTELKIDDLFLEKAQAYKNTTKEKGMINQWAKLITSNSKNESVVAKDLPRRSPYVAATFKYKSYYAKRTSSKELFPSTLKNAIAMAQKYKTQQEIKKEDFLIQDGGDLNGMIEKRFFKLHGTELIGYHERSMKPKIKINLLNVKDITSTMEESESTGKPVRNFTNLVLFGECFTLLFYNNESISFNSQSSDKVTREWYATLKEVIDLNVTHQPWIKRLANDI